MVDFKKSFSIGISAAEKAEKSKKEISSVFQNLNDQLGQATNGKIFIERVKFYEPTDFFDLSLFKKRPTYWGIGAKNPTASDTKTREIAKWSQDKAGYPCKISFGKNVIHCEDKQALELGLSELLEDPGTGEIFHKLIRLPEEEAPNNTKQPEADA